MCIWGWMTCKIATMLHIYVINLRGGLLLVQLIFLFLELSDFNFLPILLFFWKPSKNFDGYIKQCRLDTIWNLLKTFNFVLVVYSPHCMCSRTFFLSAWPFVSLFSAKALPKIIWKLCPNEVQKLLEEDEKVRHRLWCYWICFSYIVQFIFSHFTNGI